MRTSGRAEVVSGFSRTFLICLLILLAAPASSRAQELARFSLDSAIAIDKFVGQNTTELPNVVIDVTAVARLAPGWVVYFRPWIRHDPRDEVWNNEIYQAALQYERPGPLAVRIDAGYIVSPIGLGLMDSRPGINPTISTHLAYVQALPAFDPGSIPRSVRVMPISGTYPPGGQLTLSTARWDARVAVVGSAPNRQYVIHKADNPRMTPVMVVGGGITPVTGLRLGLAAATGDYLTGDELTVPQENGRGLRMLALEGEYSFGYTKLSGEVVRDRLEKAIGADHAYAWFVQGMHTLTPRWFVAARQEGVSAPLLLTATPTPSRPTMYTTETTVGYRLSPELTLRGSFVSRKAYTRAAWDQQAGISLVWAQRWR
jgi:hypothetical protein